MKNQYFKTIYLAFYSATAYKNALENWRGYGLKYLFILTLATSIIASSGWAIKIAQINPKHVADAITNIVLSQPDLTFEENINRSLNILHQLPKLRIENGTAITDITQPYAIIDPASGKELAIIDTTGELKSLENTEANLLLTKTSLIIRDSKNSDKPKETVMHLHDINKNYGIDDAKINEVLFIAEQVPAFGLREGQFFTEDNQLYKILNVKGQVIAEIGPDAKFNEKNFEPSLIITNDELAFKSELLKEVSHIKSSLITEDNMFGSFVYIIETAKKFILIGIPVIALPSVLLASFMFGTIILTFYSLLCYAYMRIAKVAQFDFKQTTRLTAVAITPMQIIAVSFPNMLPSQGTIHFLITIGYLYFAVKSVTSR